MWRDTQLVCQEIPLSDQIIHSKTISIQPVLDYELSHGLWDLLSIQSVNMIHSYMLLPAFSGTYVCMHMFLIVYAITTKAVGF